MSVACFHEAKQHKKNCTTCVWSYDLQRATQVTRLSSLNILIGTGKTDHTFIHYYCKYDDHTRELSLTDYPLATEQNRSAAGMRVHVDSTIVRNGAATELEASLYLGELINIMSGLR
jgi:hypothetical protein